MSNIFSTTTADRANESSLFSATNPTTGTALTTGNASLVVVFQPTIPFIVIKNNATVASNTKTWLHSLNISMATVAGSVTSVQSAVVIDTGDRTPTSAQVPITPLNTTPGGKTSTTQVWAAGGSANLLVPAAVSARTVARRVLRAGLNVINDEYEIKFGDEGPSNRMPAAAVGTFSSSLPPVVLLPQQFALIHLWWIAGAAATMSYEFDLILSER